MRTSCFGKSELLALSIVRKLRIAVLIALSIVMPSLLSSSFTAHATTTVCNTNTLDWPYATQDGDFVIVLTTCGTGQTGNGTFSSVTHNVTMVCPVNPCNQDIKVVQWRLEFLGLNFFSKSYNYTVT